MVKSYAIPCLFLLAFQLQAAAGTEPPKSAAIDYSKEAFVLEQSSDKFKFENDGSYTREIYTRARIQSEAGVQHFSVVKFVFQSSSETLATDHVRVTKPDGTIVVTPADTYQDMPADITRAAPFYSDAHEMQVAVKGLGVGDVLEYQALWRHDKPLIPGQFWLDYTFAHEGIVLQETVEVSVPRGRALKLKSPTIKPAMTESGVYVVYTWTSSNLNNKDDKQQKQEQHEDAWRQARGRMRQPDFELSSFKSWQEVGDWYQSLQRDRVKPSAEVQAKAAALTKGMVDGDAKIHALYDFVSTKYRYIGIAFGIGRYQPHDANEVLANQYGDCKDKHTLFAALLNAAGIKAYPALISSTHEIDPDVPSPGQFDHVITAIPQAQGLLWLDTTTEVAPFGLLIPPLREKHALVIADDKPATLIATPTDAPFPTLEKFTMASKLSDTGVLEGQAEETDRGDGELLLRSAFRIVPLPQWKDMVQRISYALGFGGDVSEVDATPPEKTGEPFHFSYNYKRKDYSDWANRRIGAPLPLISLPQLDDDIAPTVPIWLGSPGDFVFHATVELPKGYTPDLPKTVRIKQDFADYDATYTYNSGVLTAERHMTIKLREVPTSQYAEYRSFRKAVEDDYGAYTSLSTGSSAVAKSYQDEIWNLPYSDNAEASRLYDDARAAYQRNDVQAEIAALKHAVELDPKFLRAWLWLGEIYKYNRQSDLALEAYRKGIEIDPEQPVGYKALGQTLMEMGKWDDAVPILQQLVKVAPNEAWGFHALGATLDGLERYRDAIAPLEAAAKLAPEDATSELLLGRAYAHSGNLDSARECFQKTLANDSSLPILNDIAYDLAEVNSDLKRALDYAKATVGQEEKDTLKTNIASLQQEDLAHPNRLSTFWDTLGWVYYRLNDLDSAERYLNASWVLSQRHVTGEHLGRVYERQGNKARALNTYRAAYAGIPLGPDMHKLRRFEKDARTLEEDIRRLGGTIPTSYESFPEMNSQRTVKLPRLVEGTATAEFFVILGPAKAVETKLISGSDSLKGAGKTLETAKFNAPFPDENPTRILRRGILGCYPSSGCSFVLLPTVAVTSV